MNRPYVIAELSGNHRGDISKAIALMTAAKHAGADAVKLQTYTADTITMDCDREDFLIKGGPWHGYKLYDLYKEAHTPWDWHETLFRKAKEIDIAIFSTPFDESAVDFLEQLKAPIYKIASFELVHHPLLVRVAKTSKPIIMSTGMASFNEISEAVDVVMSHGCTNLTLLHCVSEYPASIQNCNLATMKDLKIQFPQCKIGLSDHTLGTTVAIASVALGAEVIEKHITLKREDGGVDASFSLEPHEFQQLCESVRDCYDALGVVNYSRSDTEQKSKMFRRSIYAIKNIEKGEPFSKDNIKVIRPAYGAAPKYFDSLLKLSSDKIYQRGDRIVYEE